VLVEVLAASALLAAAGADETAPCVPDTYEAALDCLDALLSDESKSRIDSMSHGGLAMTHFGLGLWIRNNWIHGDRAPVAASMREMGFLHPDDMSGVIIEGYWARRNGCTIDMSAYVAFYASFWDAQDQWTEEPDPETGIIRMIPPEDGFEDVLPRPVPDCPFPLDEAPQPIEPVEAPH